MAASELSVGTAHLTPMPAEEWQVRPFTTAFARQMGVAERDLYGPRFRSVYRGILIASAVPDTIVVRARAARLLLPKDAVFSHHTAARLLGGPAPDTSFIHASIGRDHRRRIAQVQLHRFTYEPDAMWRHGLPVTTPAQTFLHLALGLDLLHVVALGDALVRRGRIARDSLRAEVASWQGHGAAAASLAVDHVRDGVDSPPESHLRLLFVLAGLPEPEVDAQIVDEEGVLMFRVELAFRNTPRRGPQGQVNLGFEYDGREWHSTPEQKGHDADRRAALREQGWFIEVLTAGDLYRATEITLNRARDLMAQFGIPVPERLSDEWRRHYWAPAWSARPEGVN